MDNKLMDLEEEKNKKEENVSAQKQKEDVAQIFGLSLSQIEQVILPNGKEYFKFYNPDDGSLKMIENRSDGMNLSQQFKEVQNHLNSGQGKDDKENAKAIFNYRMQYYNVEMNLIPIRDLNNNKTAYKSAFDGLSVETKKSIRVLIENMDYLDLQYINLENAIAIDTSSRVISAQYDYKTGQCRLVAAEVRTHQDEKVSVDGEGYTFDVTEEEFDAAVDSIFVASDNPEIEDGYELQGDTVIRGRVVNMTFALQAQAYPEIIDRSELSQEDKAMYRGIVKALNRKAAKVRSNAKAKQYVLTKRENNQVAFVDNTLMVLILGFCSGILMSTIILAVKALT